MKQDTTPSPPPALLPTPSISSITPCMQRHVLTWQRTGRRWLKPVLTPIWAGRHHWEDGPGVPSKVKNRKSHKNKWRNCQKEITKTKKSEHNLNWGLKRERFKMPEEEVIVGKMRQKEGMVMDEGNC